MDAKTKRKHLREYTTAARNLELAGVAVTILEGMNTREATSAVNALQRGQKRQLKLLDAAAAKLGAPYGA